MAASPPPGGIDATTSARPVGQQPWFQPVWAAPDIPSLVDAYAHVCLLIWRRSAGAIELVRRASDEGDELFMLNDSSHYLALVTDLGWSEKACERWAAAGMRHALLG